MNWSLVLMAISTVAWCQAIPMPQLWIYAGAVTATAVGKYLWEIYL